MSHFKQQSLGHAAFLFGNRESASGFGSVMEEDRADDTAINNDEIEGNVREAADGFDIRDLLLDETD